jgi:hypothetical protein
MTMAKTKSAIFEDVFIFLLEKMDIFSRKLSKDPPKT